MTAHEDSPAALPEPPDLRPCPFCGSAELHVGDADDFQDPRRPAAAVACETCGAKGPVADGAGGGRRAAEHWNRRAAPRAEDCPR